jgi:hypothetical protein
VTAKRRDPQNQIDKLEQLMREANGVIKDLKVQLEAAQKVTYEYIEGVIKDELHKGIKNMMDAILEAQGKAVQKTFAEFDKIQAILLGKDDKKGMSLEQIAEMVALAEQAEQLRPALTRKVKEAMRDNS